MRTLIVNFKNYSTILGTRSVDLARAAAKVASQSEAEIIVAPPTPALALVASKVDIRVFAQSVSPSNGEKTTGSVLPEAVKAAGASGTILNHSEARLPRREIATLIQSLRTLRLDACLCARTSREAAELSRFRTKYLAVEPPELIGTGVAVSKARPELIVRSVAAVRRAGYGGRVLCGAGIVSGADVKKAMDLGADGVLVASSVVKAPDWELKIEELARSLV
jgi:triosephosphate isomerase